MAASDARPMPRKNTAFRVTFPIYDSSGDLKTGASGLDSEVSIDGGTFADCTNEATEIATSSGIYYLDLTAGELNGDTIAINIKSTSNKTTTIVIYPEELGDIRVDVGQISGDATAADNLESFMDGTGYAGTNNVIPTVTTVTNLTNAPTSGDLTATMKTSVTTAASAATPSVTVSDKTGFSLSSAGIQAIWDALTSALTTAGSIGKLLVDNVNATISSRSSHTAANVRTEMDSNSTQLAKLGTPAGASMSADIAAVKAETASIQSDTNDLQTQIGTAGAGLTAVASAANLATLTGYVDTEVAAIKAKTDNLPASPAATGDIPSANSIASAVWAFVTAGGYTATQVLRLMVSVLAGKSSGGGTTTVVFRDLDDTKDRIVATVDADGNRTAVVRDAT